MTAALFVLISLGVLTGLWWLFFAGIRADMDAIAEINARRARRDKARKESR
ncbi:hypothetical protein HNR06_002383 [Nocardiopsis arvandica]|jgi:hypothetical protein|uniref:Uncharacterized protein n=1 Tax=Nocardiopsis sinuspersici TaxID=501010 RepID=A0A7Y9XBM4_9ACTN|nr:hypothetical protein [Nocardiopsis sinuspersici]NYH52794.1 hypothetical protein [Nocardiopsis sinuspersici]